MSDTPFEPLIRQSFSVSAARSEGNAVSASRAHSSACHARRPFAARSAVREADERGQVDDVGRRVRGHRRRERPLAPVRALVRLVERDADARGEERGEADLLLADELRRDHRVEERRRAEAVAAEEQAQVVVGPVQEERPRREPREERREVDAGERVHEERVGAEADLHEAYLFVVVVEGIGLRVERDGRAGLRVEAGEEAGERRLGLRDGERARALESRSGGGVVTGRRGYHPQPGSPPSRNPFLSRDFS